MYTGGDRLGWRVARGAANTAKQASRVYLSAPQAVYLAERVEVLVATIHHYLPRDVLVALNNTARHELLWM